MTNLKPSKSDVLAAVNELRTEHGLGEPLTELPQGRPTCGRSCVIARALHGVTSPGYTRRYVTTDAGGLVLEKIEHPTVIKRFIDFFDLGEYPELIET